MNYSVSLDVYNGPFDLLLQLIERHDLDICDVSLSTVTADFLQYMQAAQIDSTDMQAFLNVATQLVKIKSSTLARQLGETTPDDVLEPATDLTERLQAYQICRGQAKQLAALQKTPSYQHPVASDRKPQPGQYKSLVNKLGLAFQQAFDYHQHKSQFELRLARNKPQLQSYRQSFVKCFVGNNHRNLDDIIESCSNKDQRIVYFLCVLEGVRARQFSLSLRQNNLVVERLV